MAMHILTVLVMLIMSKNMSSKAAQTDRTFLAVSGVDGAVPQENTCYWQSKLHNCWGLARVQQRVDTCKVSLGTERLVVQFLGSMTGLLQQFATYASCNSVPVGR